MIPSRPAFIFGLLTAACLALQPQAQAQFKLPVVDLSRDTAKHVMVAEGTELVYQGHPTTVLLPDGKTIYAVWTYEHGGFCGPMKRSDDGGKTWSPLLQTPESWSSVKNCPTIWRLQDPQGNWNMHVYAGSGPSGKGMYRSTSTDEGKTWSEMEHLGLPRGPMPFCTIEPIHGGKALLGMSNIRRPGEKAEAKSNIVVQSISTDGGFSWAPWETVLDLPGLKPCEPWVIRSPDGKQLLCLMRENEKRVCLQMTSEDEGKTWSAPKPLPQGLHGDRHVAKYTADGRLVVCFRDKEKGSPTFNHFVAWVGSYEDILKGEDNGYRIKLLHSYKGGDNGYSGVEILPDGTIVATTYIKYRSGPERNSVVSIRFDLDETDRLARRAGWKR